MAELRIHTDGASRGNPGDASFAFVIVCPGRASIEDAGKLGTLTNNQAEYTALVRALERALQVGAEHRLIIHSDSELMVKQMKGEYKVKNADLRSLYEQACKLAAQFASVEYCHVRREQNKRADELCNLALDGKMGKMGGKDLEEEVPVTFGLADEAIALLGLAEAQPTPEVVWSRLVAVLAKHGVRLPL